MCANQKNRCNQILRIKDGNGVHCNTREATKGAFTQYFQELFTAGENLDIPTCVADLERKVTPAMNNILCNACPLQIDFKSVGK